MSNKFKKVIEESTNFLKKVGVLPSTYPHHKKAQPYTLLRSELLKYKEMHGHDFTVPNGSMIIED